MSNSSLKQANPWGSLCALAMCLLVPAFLRAQQVALTFDDLPAHGPLPEGVTRVQVIRDILLALQASGTPPVYGFVNGIHVEEHPGDAEVLDLWRKADYPLGNHTWSHMNLNGHTTAEWEADVLKNEPVIEPRMQGEDWRWLRYPFLAEGDSVQKIGDIRNFLAQHRYKIAGVTMSFGDYAFNDPYARCLAKKDATAVTHLEGEYLQAARGELIDRRAMSQAAFGHPIPLVLLMHVGAFDAHMLPRLLDLYKSEGVQFVSLQTAEQDNFYRNDVDPQLPASPNSLEAVIALRSRSVPRHPAPVDELNKLCR